MDKEWIANVRFFLLEKSLPNPNGFLPINLILLYLKEWIGTLGNVTFSHPRKEFFLVPHKSLR